MFKLKPTTHAGYYWLFYAFCLLLVSVGTSTVAQSKSKAELICDTISQNLNAAKNDTAKLNAVLIKIRRCRRKIGKHYEPFLSEYIEKTKAVNYQYGLMKAYDFLGLQKRYNESYQEAVELHLLSLEIAKGLNDTLQMCYNYNNLGQAYRKQDLNAIALPYFHRALNLQEQMGHEKSASYTHNTLGATYLSQQEFDKALYHLKTSNKLAIARNDIRTMSFNYGMIGEIYLINNEPDKAIPFFNKALKIKKKLNYDKGIAVTLHLLAQAYFQKQELQKAEALFSEAIEIHQKYNNKRYLSLCYAYMGKIYTQQNRFNDAETTLMKALKMADEVHSIEQLILVNDALNELYGQNNQWDKAYTYLLATNNWQDSLNIAKYEKTIQSLEIGYQTQKKEQQIAILSSANKIKTQRIRLGIAIIIILMLVLSFVFYILSIRKKNALLQEEKLRQQLLKSQMNPHFIFNSLGSIQNYMYRNEPDKAARYMGNFAKLTRSILNNSSSDTVSLDEEIETLTNYLELEQMRMKRAFDYKISYSDELETELINIPPLLLQPFVENAIKHGLREFSEGGFIRLSFIEVNNFIRIEIEDNGIGINQTSSDKSHKSLATQIFKQRISILANNYPDLPQAQIKDLSDDNKTGTLVVVHLPIME